jgi:hypothetical protein
MAVSMVSCEEFLDKEQMTDVSADDAFKNFFNFQGFVEEIYHCIPDFANQQYNNSFNWGEEEHYSLNGVNQNILISKLDLGNFWAWQREYAPGDTWMDRDPVSTSSNNGNTGDVRWQKALWPLAWVGIAKANLGLANLDKFVGTEDEKKLIEGQLYFFRGWFHFQLIQYFGGLPYIDRVLDVSQKIELPRESYHACADKAAADFRKAADLLPMHWYDVNTTSGNEYRINKAMAMAYLGKNYLWAGSPLMNKLLTGSETYNTDYCQLASDAFGEFLNLVETDQTRYALNDFASYASSWMTTTGITPGKITNPGSLASKTEVIFKGPHYGGTGWSLNHQYLAANILFGRSWSFYPTANYVNYFGMKNGLPINDFVTGQGHLSNVASAESGYNPSYPWRNRDPRFYKTFAFDTQQMVLGTLTAEQEGWRYANLFTYNSVDEPITYRNPQSGSTTGYLLRKYNPDGVNRFDGAWSGHVIHIPWMRLADVYLMYAEATVNATGDVNGKSNNVNLTAVQAINKVRARAGVDPVNAKFLGLVSEFMSEVRRERAVELAYEGHRFNDLRRWLLLDKAPYTYKKAIEFTRRSKTRFSKTDAASNEVVGLTERIVLERKFDAKHYWLPLKKAETYMYLEFPQNPGW